MKKYVLMALLLATSAMIYAQRPSQAVIKWFSLAGKGGYGNSILMNKSVFDDVNVNIDRMSPSSVYGARFGFTHGDNIGISVEALWSKFGQNYEISVPDNSIFYEKEMVISSFDYVALLRYTNEYGFILEAGPKFSQVKLAEYRNSGQGIDGSTQEIAAIFQPQFNSIVLGIGNSLIRSDRVELNLTLRATYGFKDFIVDETVLIEDNVYNRSVPDFVERYTGTYNETHPLTIQAMLEFNYFFAFYGDPSCGKGRLMFFQ